VWSDTNSPSLAFARMPRAAARGGLATGDRGVARRAKTGLPRQSVVPAGGFGGVPLGFATDAPRGSAGSFTFSPVRFLILFPPRNVLKCWMFMKAPNGGVSEMRKALAVIDLPEEVYLFLSSLSLTRDRMLSESGKLH